MRQRKRERAFGGKVCNHSSVAARGDDTHENHATLRVYRPDTIKSQLVEKVRACQAIAAAWQARGPRSSGMRNGATQQYDRAGFGWRKFCSGKLARGADMPEGHRAITNLAMHRNSNCPPRAGTPLASWLAESKTLQTVGNVQPARQRRAAGGRRCRQAMPPTDRLSSDQTTTLAGSGTAADKNSTRSPVGLLPEPEMLCTTNVSVFAPATTPELITIGDRLEKEADVETGVAEPFKYNSPGLSLPHCPTSDKYGPGEENVSSYL